MNDRQQLVVIMGVFGLLLVGELVYGYFCWDEKATLDNTLKKLKTEESSLQAKLGQIGSLREESKELQAIIEEYVTILPTEQEARSETFLVAIDEFARDSGLQNLGGEPEEVKNTSRRSRGKKAKERKNFIQHRYRFKFQGTFPSFLKFMNRVENDTRYLRIDDFDIRPFGSEESDQGVDELVLAEDPRKEIMVVISTYTYSKQTAEEAK